MPRTTLHPHTLTRAASQANSVAFDARRAAAQSRATGDDEAAGAAEGLAEAARLYSASLLAFSDVLARSVRS